MASRSKLSVSRSVALSLAALLVLSGAMFLVSTFQADSEEWVLVEDEVLGEIGIKSGYSATGESPEYVYTFDDETATYTYDVTGGDKASSKINNLYYFEILDGFDFSKNYQIRIVSEVQPYEVLFYDSVNNIRSLYHLNSVQADDDGIYTASVTMLDQLVTDMEYQEGIYFNCVTESASTTFAENTFSIQVYELHSDNTGSIAAGITGLVLIVMGIFAMPMHNILRGH